MNPQNFEKKPADFEKRPLIILGNYGDESLALIQWIYEQNLSVQSLEVVTVKTGWAGELWSSRLPLCENYVKSLGFKATTLVSAISFAEAVRGRHEFPSAKFQWCSALLKGLPFLDWLDSFDPHCQAIILLAKRKAAAKAHAHLPEWIEKSEFFNDRTVWHPILEIQNIERDALLKRAGFSPLNHRSLECDPCVHSSCSDLSRLSESDIKKTRDLEIELGIPIVLESSLAPLLEHSLDPSLKDSSQHSFLGSSLNSSLGSSSSMLSSVEEQSTEEQSIEERSIEEQYLDLFYRGCGNHYGCGL